MAAGPDVCVIERRASLQAVERLQKEKITLVSDVSMTDLTNLAISTKTKVPNVIGSTQLDLSLLF